MTRVAVWAVICVQAIAYVAPAHAQWQRIVSLAPHATEIVAAAGGEARLVGVSQSCDFPASVKSLPKIASVSGVNIEKVLALKPDAVIVWRGGNRPQDIERLIALGLNVIDSSPKSIDDIARDIKTIGAQLHTAAHAQRSVDAMNALRDSLNRPNNANPQRVFYQLGSGALYTLNDQHPVMEALRACGGRNVFGHLPLLAPQVSIEAVVLAKPQVIAVANRADLPEVSAAWRARAAAFSGTMPKIIAVDGERLHRASPRLLAAAVEMCDALAQTVRP